MLASKIAHGLCRNACVSHPSRYQPISPSGPVGNRVLAGLKRQGIGQQHGEPGEEQGGEPGFSAGPLQRRPPGVPRHPSPRGPERRKNMLTNRARLAVAIVLAADVER